MHYSKNMNAQKKIEKMEASWKKHADKQAKIARNEWFYGAARSRNADATDLFGNTDDKPAEVDDLDFAML